MQSLVAADPALDEKIADAAGRTDEFTCFPAGHSARVADLAERIAAAMGVGSEDRATLKTAAAIRDIGELRMGRDYIAGARTLSADERLDLRRHPVIGEQQAAKLDLDRGVQLVIRWHHEWWCGSGYPDGLAGEEIPLNARILRVADAYCALISERPFRAAHPIGNARKFLIEWSGIEFDPTVVRTLLDIEPEPSPAENQYQ